VTRISIPQWDIFLPKIELGYVFFGESAQTQGYRDSYKEGNRYKEDKRCTAAYRSYAVSYQRHLPQRSFILVQQCKTYSMYAEAAVVRRITRGERFESSLEANLWINY